MNRQLVSRLLKNSCVPKSVPSTPKRHGSRLARSLLTVPFFENQRPYLSHVRNDPFFRGFFPSSMNKWFDEMDREMEGFFDKSFLRTWEEGGMKVTAGKDTFEVEVDVRGFDPKDIQVTLERGVLTIEGKLEEKSSKGEKYVARQFTRRFTLPEGVDMEKAKSLIDKNGILRIEAPFNPPKIEETPKETPIEIRKV